ncbi:tRNA (guanosine(37)-N1)-methyltransferase TrmD [candidate division WOR-3 bacterium]|nr:tRNA (guanosine(37)-N1)-methyltransferase TrmD [candidate division WOR-3 bacterium]
MKVHIVTIFPEFFSGPFDCGPTRIAREKGVLEINLVNPRDFTTDLHRTVDDYPFGGGAGMVMKPEPICDAVESVRTPDSRVILLSPQGKRFDQAMAHRLKELPHIVLICGRYKGVDERVRVLLVDEEVSIGDYVLAGGEAAAVVVIEAIARLLPGAVGDEDSVATDSFAQGLLDAPLYTRPREFRGLAVPEVLISGNHAAVAKWRREQALLATARRRPDLLNKVTLTPEDQEFLRKSLGKEFVYGTEAEK